MTYDVRWMPRARRQAAAVQAWWIANRELAPTMFRDELARVITLRSPWRSASVGP